MFIEFLKGTALLLALCFLYGANTRWWGQRVLTGQILSGLIFGGICVAGMLMPMSPAPGVLLDARPVVLSMAALFGGPLVAGVAVVMTVAARLWLGGVGAEPAIFLIVLATAWGLAYRAARQRGMVNVTPTNLALFGLLVHATAIALFQLLPGEVPLSLTRTLGLPYLLVLTAATVVIGLVLHDVENRMQTERELAQTAARLHAITQAVPDLLMVLDADGRYLEVLSPNDNMLALQAQQLKGRLLHDVFPLQQADRFLSLLRQTLKTGTTQRIEYEILTLAGLRHFEGRTQPLEVDGKAAVVLLARDTTERRHAEQALLESETRFRSMLLSIPSVAVQAYQKDGTTSYWNQASETLYGYTAEEAIGRNLLELIVPPSMRDSVQASVTHMFHTGETLPNGEMRLQRKNGSLVDVLSSHALVQVPGQSPEMFCIDVDISERRASEEEARQLAFYDVLTQLPNRRLLEDRLQQVLTHCQRYGLHTAVVFIDLDHFKALNDSHGHAVGDLLLCEVALRLRGCVREQDTVARLGGDEFVVVLQELSRHTQEAAAQARALGEAILVQLRQRYDLEGHECHTSASIGVTLLSPHQNSVGDALKQADRAMYRAKNTGRNALQFFDPSEGAATTLFPKDPVVTEVAAAELSA